MGHLRLRVWALSHSQDQNPAPAAALKHLPLHASAPSPEKWKSYD